MEESRGTQINFTMKYFLRYKTHDYLVVKLKKKSKHERD